MDDPVPYRLTLLLRLELRRIADAFREPRAGVWAGIALPAALVGGGLWLAGDAFRPDVSTGDGATQLGLLVSIPVTLQAYPILFRPADDAFVRRLALPAAALFGARALRLVALALLVVAALMIPFVATGASVSRPLGIALAAAVASTAGSLLAQAHAAERIALGAPPSPLSRTMARDPELAAASALVFAPVWALAAGAIGARLAAADAWPLAARVATIVAASALAAALAARWFARALPRFAPHAGELAYAPPPDASGGELVVGRGIARVLPRAAQAARARDALVLARRYRWTGRLTWPVAIVAALALVRAGSHPAVRAWAALGAAVLLLAQAAAVVALGRAERGRTRWIDRVLGVTSTARVIGRWASAFGLALGVAVPVTIGWWLGVDGGGAWLWPAGAVVVASLASVASVAAGGR